MQWLGEEPWPLSPSPLSRALRNIRLQAGEADAIDRTHCKQPRYVATYVRTTSTDSQQTTRYCMYLPVSQRNLYIARITKTRAALIKNKFRLRYWQTRRNSSEKDIVRPVHTSGAELGSSHMCEETKWNKINGDGLRRLRLSHSRTWRYGLAEKFYFVAGVRVYCDKMKQVVFKWFSFSLFCVILFYFIENVRGLLGRC